MDAVILFPLRSKTSKFVKFDNSARKKIEGKKRKKKERVIRSFISNEHKNIDSN